MTGMLHDRRPWKAIVRKIHALAARNRRLLEIYASALQQIGIASVALGVLLLVSSFAFRYALPQDVLWSDEQAEEFLGVRAEYHHLAFAEGEESSKFQESQAAYESQRNELDRAIAFRDRTPLRLRLGGLVACVMGIAMLRIHRGRSR